MKHEDEMLAAWADDPRSLTPEERAEVEARVERSPELARDAGELRALLAKLRALPEEGEEPAWDGFSRTLRERIEAAPPQRFRRWLARWWKPAFGLGLAATAAAIVIVMSDSKDDVAPPAPSVATGTPDAAAPVPAPRVVVPLPPPSPTADDDRDAPLALGAEGDVPSADLDDDAADQVALALGEDPDDDEDDAPDGLIPDLSLDFVDDLDDAQLDRVDAWLAEN